MVNENKKPEKTGLMDTARRAAKELGTFTFWDLADAVHNAGINVQTAEEVQLIRSVIQRFKQQKEVVSLGGSPMRYGYVKKKRPRTKMEKIWHLIRSRQKFTLADMVRGSGATENTVREYLHGLVKAGFLKKASYRVWYLAKDPGPQVPLTTHECKVLRVGQLSMNNEQ